MNQRKPPEMRLGPIKESDLTKLLEWRNDIAIYKWCRQCEPITEAKHKAWFHGLHADESTKMYAVYKSKSEDIVGVCGLTSIDWINRRAEFSLYIGPEHWGKGYGEAALSRLVRVAFNIFNLNCVWGEAFEGNPAVDVFKRVGFHYEGARRKFYYREGRFIDATLWSILRKDM